MDLDVLIGSIAITIDHAKHDNSSAKNDAQIKRWKERGAIELKRFRREKKRLDASKSETKKVKVHSSKDPEDDSKIKETKAEN